MAASGATLSSCFSTCSINSKHASPDSALFRVACVSTLQLQVPSISCSQSLDSSLLTTAPVISDRYRWRAPRISAAVAHQEEVGVGALEIEALEQKVVEEEEEEEELPNSSSSIEGGDYDEVGSDTKLYFGNLPYSCDSAQLAGIIQDYGSPELVEVLYDSKTGKSRGFAFVTMSTVEDCNAVIQNLDGSELYGRTIKVNFSNKPKPKEPLYPESDYKLFVGNLKWSVSSESLTEMFQQYGNVVGARVLYDGETGKSRGYGFVCYSTKEEMDVALESLDGVELEGRAMRVSLATGRRN